MMSVMELDQERRKGHIGILGKKEASQLMELWKELANEVIKLSFRFLSFKLGKFVSSFSSYNLAISARKVRVRL